MFLERGKNFFVLSNLHFVSFVEEPMLLIREENKHIVGYSNVPLNTV
jgi:hypothetical protein